MKILTTILLMTTLAGAAEDTLMVDPVTITAAFSLDQVKAYVEYWAKEELKDSGIVLQKGAEEYGKNAVRIYQKSRVESLETLFTLIYLSYHLEVAEDCKDRWEYMQWFKETGDKLGIPSAFLKGIEESVLEVLMSVCSDLCQEKPFGEQGGQ